MIKKICVVTGTRADYGILHPVMTAIKRSKKLKLYTIATGMHLMKEFGRTVYEIENDGFEIHRKLDISYIADTGEAMAVSVGKAITAFAGAFRELKPEMVTVLGDRGEMLAAAIAAAYLNIPVAHIHGGEISGHVDGLVRHAITKLAHVHFAATESAAQRIIRMGEEKWRVFTVGAPALDRILKAEVTPKAILIEKYRIKKDLPLILLAQHPVIKDYAQASRQMKISLEALKSVAAQLIIIYPNADAGGRRMIKIIKQYLGQGSCFSVYSSVPHKDYLGLLSVAAVLVGNSSSGIIEAPAFGLPVVNIGDRQQGRERAGNVIDVRYNKDEISRAVKKIIAGLEPDSGRKTSRNPFGDGHAGARIVRIIEKLPFGAKLLQKKMSY